MELCESGQNVTVGGRVDGNGKNIVSIVVVRNEGKLLTVERPGGHISSAVRVKPTLEHHGGPIMHSGLFCVKTDCVARIAKFSVESRDAWARPGTMWAVVASRRSHGMSTLHVCVDWWHRLVV